MYKGNISYIYNKIYCIRCITCCWVAFVFCTQCARHKRVVCVCFYSSWARAIALLYLFFIYCIICVHRVWNSLPFVIIIIVVDDVLVVSVVVVAVAVANMLFGQTLSLRSPSARCCYLFFG